MLVLYKNLCNKLITIYFSFSFILYTHSHSAIFKKMSHKRANSNVNDSSEGENDEWYNDVIEFLPSQLEGNPKGYVNYDDDVIRQEPLKKNFKLTEDDYIDEEEDDI